MVTIWCDSVLLDREVCGILPSRGYMEAEEFRRHGHIGRPLGSENVLTELEEKMGCILRSKNPAPNVSQLKLTMVFPELPERRALRS
jgi:hypothetical protein